jgi:hypothetical protein
MSASKQSSNQKLLCTAMREGGAPPLVVPQARPPMLPPVTKFPSAVDAV